MFCWASDWPDGDILVESVRLEGTRKLPFSLHSKVSGSYLVNQSTPSRTRGSIWDLLVLMMPAFLLATCCRLQHCEQIAPPRRQVHQVTAVGVSLAAKAGQTHRGKRLTEDATNLQKAGDQGQRSFRISLPEDSE
ncbi:Alpha 1,6 mannosyltransferase [Trichuris trichiura]|uniref:Alpha 1,6 mannosyltransferase n=1 Tax=Trichuris trichiura TaxID=36087 RepID=A0A077YWU0_TRITR|nr:Alpha 1,6 mannosyltransferase [Trichuris trichiura]